MTYEQYLSAIPVLTEKVSSALVSVVSALSLSEAKKIDWLTASADKNIEADKVDAA